MLNSLFQAFDQYIAPTVVFADIVVPRGGENSVAIDLIVRHVRTQLEQVRILVVFFLYLFQGKMAQFLHLRHPSDNQVWICH